VARVCEFDSGVNEGEVVRPAPEPHLVSQPLTAVYDGHLQLGLQGTLDPIYFAIVVDRNWKESAVLLVTLENPYQPPVIGSFFCKPEGVGSTV
jgi:hypothetical protein